jgi:hypothetical protein
MTIWCGPGWGALALTQINGPPRVLSYDIEYDLGIAVQTNYCNLMEKVVRHFLINACQIATMTAVHPPRRFGVLELVATTWPVFAKRPKASDRRHTSESYFIDLFGGVPRG